MLRESNRGQDMQMYFVPFSASVYSVIATLQWRNVLLSNAFPAFVLCCTYMFRIVDRVWSGRFPSTSIVFSRMSQVLTLRR